MDLAIRCEKLSIPKPVRLPVKLSHHAARFAHQQNSGGGVPGVQAKLPKAFEPPAGYGSQVHGSRAVPAHAMRAQSKIPVVVDVRILGALHAGESCAKQTCR